MDTELKKAYIIYACWTDLDDVGLWLWDNNISYNIRVTSEPTNIPSRLHNKPNDTMWVIYSVYLTEEESTIIGLIFINTVVTEAKKEPDVGLLIHKVIKGVLNI
jgi:hypothetical protein